MAKRLFDLLLLFLIAPIFIPLMLIIALLVKISSKGKVLFWSKRIGFDNKIFMMPKFRSMRVNTPDIATHLLLDSHKYLTPIGAILRKYSLDELPQLWCILSGRMSFVGPRPALFNQDDLIALRTEKNIQHLKPGITGWAQINGRDDISIAQKVYFDSFYRDKQSLWFDIKILIHTFFKVITSKNINH